MTPVGLAVLSVSVVIALSWLLCHLVVKRWGREMVEEFVEIFPGVCPVCSYHHYLVTHGYNVDLQADHHDCHGKLSLSLFGKRAA